MSSRAQQTTQHARMRTHAHTHVHARAPARMHAGSTIRDEGGMHASQSGLPGLEGHCLTVRADNTLQAFDRTTGYRSARKDRKGLEGLRVDASVFQKWSRAELHGAFCVNFLSNLGNQIAIEKCHVLSYPPPGTDNEPQPQGATNQANPAWHIEPLQSKRYDSVAQFYSSQA
eukprot:1158883-Pelagomonas_calceolata.AAC.13